MNYDVKVWILCTCLDMAYILNNCEIHSMDVVGTSMYNAMV